jgi:excisionase family DNA binding protein
MGILPAKWDGRPTLTVDEVAEILGISRWTAYEAVNKRQIPAVRVGRRWIVPHAALEKMLDVTVATG